MSAAEIAAALGGARREGKEWRCLCPAHNDSEPSLSITEKSGKLLFKCRANCECAAYGPRRTGTACNKIR
jgi:hypothetical protein